MNKGAWGASLTIVVSIFIMVEFSPMNQLCLAIWKCIEQINFHLNLWFFDFSLVSPISFYWSTVTLENIKKQRFSDVFQCFQISGIKMVKADLACWCSNNLRVLPLHDTSEVLLSLFLIPEHRSNWDSFLEKALCHRYSSTNFVKLSLFFSANIVNTSD